MDNRNLKIIVLAGNGSEYHRYLRDNNLNRFQAIYGCAPWVIQSLIASRVEVVGTFWQNRKDAADLYDLAMTRIFYGPIRGMEFCTTCNKDTVWTKPFGMAKYCCIECYVGSEDLKTN